MSGAGALRQALARHGLAVTGRFRPGPGDGAPEGTALLCLVGPEDGAMWQAFAAAPEASDGAPHPMDRWSERVLGEVAAEVGGAALFPFGGPPYAPFIAWARKAEGARNSPVGMLVTPGRGLWASWRGAIALFGGEDAAEDGADDFPDPCRDCPAPCLTTCPVGALQPFEAGGYDVAACAAHVTGPDGSPCREGGCLARQACPAGAGTALPAGQRAFHMAAFLAARARGD